MKKPQKIYVEIGDMVVLKNHRYPHNAQTSGIWLINEVIKTKDTLEVRIVINKKQAWVYTASELAHYIKKLTKQPTKEK